jgi:hypothetical protein
VFAAPSVYDLGRQGQMRVVFVTFLDERSQVVGELVYRVQRYPGCGRQRARVGCSAGSYGAREPRGCGPATARSKVAVDGWRSSRRDPTRKPLPCAGQLERMNQRPRPRRLLVDTDDLRLDDRLVEMIALDSVALRCNDNRGCPVHVTEDGDHVESVELELDTGIVPHQVGEHDVKPHPALNGPADSGSAGREHHGRVGEGCPDRGLDDPSQGGRHQNAWGVVHGHSLPVAPQNRQDLADSALVPAWFPRFASGTVHCPRVCQRHRLHAGNERFLLPVKEPPSVKSGLLR